MPRLTAISWKVMECIFMMAGFVFSRHRGDHKMYLKDGCKRPVIIPMYKSIGVDIIQSNLRTAGMSRKDYFKYLESC